MRLNKYIADCGVASRRGADALVFAGRVSVNGTPVQMPGIDINPDMDSVCVDGKQLSPADNKVYIMLNKPKGVLCTCKDDRGRRTVLDIVSDIKERLFPVGRLDYDTEGLILLTNDGDFAYRCTHPKHELKKTYRALIRGNLNQEAIKMLRDGVVIDGQKTAKSQLNILEKRGDLSLVDIIIHEGRNRQVRRMFEAVGCRVEKLTRTMVGKLSLDDLKPGEWRHLSAADIEKIK